MQNTKLKRETENYLSNSTHEKSPLTMFTNVLSTTMKPHPAQLTSLPGILQQPPPNRLSTARVALPWHTYCQSDPWTRSVLPPRNSSMAPISLRMNDKRLKIHIAIFSLNFQLNTTFPSSRNEPQLSEHVLSLLSFGLYFFSALQHSFSHLSVFQPVTHHLGISLNILRGKFLIPFTLTEMRLQWLSILKCILLYHDLFFDWLFPSLTTTTWETKLWLCLPWILQVPTQVGRRG